jgi:ubiquinone/menaquinone biosynthesis C-methylase UbiE/uncharacterized protein YbaR (Trm112 family)
MSQGRATAITDIVVCPDCKRRLQGIAIGHASLGFLCESCGIVFPLESGIPILLPIKARNYALEYRLVDGISQQAKNHSMRQLVGYVGRTLDLLSQYESRTSWEWEDEAYWGKVYAKETTTAVPKSGNDRIWEREFLVEYLAGQTSFKGKTILDAGCGEGGTFRSLMAKYCDETTLYLAADISLTGLKLNRSRNAHKNSFYILCSADSLPIRKEIIDVLCYFGILHHTEGKASNIAEDSGLLRSGGYILLHEPLARPSPPLRGLWKPKVGESAHEERIDIDKLTTVISESHLQILATKRLHTIFFTGVMRIFGKIMASNRALFNLVSKLDSALMKVLGGIIPYFRTGEILLVLRRARPS